MKRLLTAALLALTSSVFAATTIPVQSLTPTGSTAGQAIVSTGPTGAPTWGSVTATALAAQAANTVVANITASSASPTAVAIPTCNTSTSALQYTPVTGWTCYASSATTTGTLAQFAATTSAQLAGVLSDETGSGSAVFSISPTLTGTPLAPTATAGTSTTQIATTAFAQTAVTGGGNAGVFTSLSASGNDALFYSNTSAQSIPNNSATTVTTWTKVSDRVNANFNASTGTFTAPATGYYQVSAQLTYAPAAGLVNANYVAQIFANGVVVANGSFFQESTSTVNVSVAVSAIVSLTAGQTILLKAFQNSGASLALTAVATQNYLSINRLP